MARVGGINIPDNKHIDVALTHIYGIGRKTAQDICNKLDIKFSKKVSELSEKELSEYGNATKDALDENTNNEAKMWANKDKTKLGKIIPLNRYKKKKFMCRDVEQNLTSDGIETKSFTTFCRNNKGDWKVI